MKKRHRPDSGSLNDRAAGDSLEQQEAEELLVSRLGERLGLKLAKKRFSLPAGSWLELDGFSESPLVLCEAWAHQGPPKSAQKFKVMTDAMKMLYVKTLFPEPGRLILAFGDTEASGHFTGTSWMAQALKTNGIEVEVVDLPQDIKQRILKAQRRQYR